MNKFRVTYPNGATEDVCVEHDLEGFKNEKFGSVDPDEYGVKIEQVDMDEADSAFAEETGKTTDKKTKAGAGGPKHHTMPVDTLIVGAKMQ